MPTHRIEISLGKVATLIAALIATVVALSVLASAGNYFVRNSTLPPEVKVAFNDRVFYGLFLGSEQNLPTWFASISLLVCALLFGLIAHVERQQAGKLAWHWMGGAGIFALMSEDEFATLHEHAAEFWRQFSARVLGRSIPWLVFSLPVILFVLAVFWGLLQALPAPVRRLLVLGGAIYLGGALAVESFTDWYSAAYTNYNLGYEMLIYLEETLEMIGVGVIQYALAYQLRLQLQGGSLAIAVVD